MLNEDKVRLMSGMAMFESTRGRRVMEIDKYSKRDYIFVQVIKAWILSTLGFGMVFLLTLFLCVDAIAIILAAVSLTFVLILIVALYIICIMLSTVFARRRAVRDYEAAKDTMTEYRGYVKRLRKFYDSEQSIEER